jgi:hypothetical protein
MALRAGVALCAALVALASATVAGGSAHPAPPQPSRALPFIASFSRSADASAWEGGSVADGLLRVRTLDENGAVATIRGGQRWRDYTLRVRAKWVAGEAMALHVRDNGPDDFVACVLDGRVARIDVVSGGVSRTLAVASAPAYAGRGLDAVAVVRGRSIGFTVDGVTLVTAVLPSMGTGTAGIAVWDPRWSHAAAEAEFVRVEDVSVPMPPGPSVTTTPTAENVDGGD